MAATPSVLFVHTYYPEFLDDLYSTDRGLGRLDFERQRRRLMDTAFCVADACSHGLRVLGCDAWDVIVNADTMQARWAVEHGLRLCGDIHDQRRRIIAAQITHYRPDVLYVFEWCPLGDAFLADVKSRVRLLVGQVASPLSAGRTYRSYDLMISSWPPLVEHFRREGVDAEALKLAFDARVLDGLSVRAPRHDVTFVGGFAPSHPDRARWLEQLLASLDIAVFGYGRENVPEGSPIHAHHHGHVWGRRMYEVLRGSRLTLNRHARIDVRGRVATGFANNMRLFEATGVGTCLVTERKDNLAEMFEPDKEVVTYGDERECVEKIRYYLEHEEDRSAIAQAGQRRTLRDHTYARRMPELLDILRQRLSKPRRLQPLRRDEFRHGVGSLIGSGVSKLRDSIARGLVTLGVAPNVLTVVGFAFTCLAAVCLVIGGGHGAPWEARRAPGPTSWWPLASAVLLTIAFASDMLDGAVARNGRLATRFGAVLDSTLDRFSDLAIFSACTIHFSLVGNITYVTLSVAAAANAVLISYVKARAEKFIDDCGVGYWQRGERCGLFLAAAYVGHIPAVLWLLGTLPMLTVIRRLIHAHSLTANGKVGRPTARAHPLQPWRSPRGSSGYDLCTGAGLAFLSAGPLIRPFFFGQTDPLGTLLARLVAA